MYATNDVCCLPHESFFAFFEIQMNPIKLTFSHMFGHLMVTNVIWTYYTNVVHTSCRIQSELGRFIPVKFSAIAARFT
jgi:hypothetical protein